MSDARIRQLERQVAQRPEDFSLRRKLIKEQIRRGQPSFRYVVVEETITQDTEDEPDHDGSIIGIETGSFEDIMSSAKSLYIESRDPRDRTSWWESYPDDDYITGGRTWHSLHVTYADGVILHQQMFEIFNQAIRDRYRTPDEFLTSED